MTNQTVGKLYPIPLDDYPKLLRYKVTPSGMHYIEDLMREIYIEKRKLSKSRLTQLGLLLKTYVCQTKRIEDEVLFHQVSDMAKRYGTAEAGFIIECINFLTMKGLIGLNPHYDPDIALNMHKEQSKKIHSD